jgi:hypothetical protein
VRKLIKDNDDVQYVGGEAQFMISRATVSPRSQVFTLGFFGSCLNHHRTLRRLSGAEQQPSTGCHLPAVQLTLTARVICAQELFIEMLTQRGKESMGSVGSKPELTYAHLASAVSTIEPLDFLRGAYWSLSSRQRVTPLGQERGLFGCAVYPHCHSRSHLWPQLCAPLSRLPPPP